MKGRVFLTMLLSGLLVTGVKPTGLSRTDYVYICQSPYSKVYHKSADCKGLSNCSTKVYKVTFDGAIKLGRRACKIDYR